MADRYDSTDFDRAEFELDMARRAPEPYIGRLHHELANRYLKRFYAERAPEALPVRPRSR